MDQEVLEVPPSRAPDVAKSDSVLTNSTSVKPEEVKKELLPKGLRPSRQRTSQRSSSRASWKIPKDPVAQGRAKNSTSIKSQASPPEKCVQTENQSKESLRAKTPPTQDLHSRSLEEEREDTSATKDPRSLEEEREDTSATKDPIVVQEPIQSSSTSHLSAISKQMDAEDTKSISNAQELVAGQQQTPRSRGPGSSQKTIKASYKKARETCRRLSSKECLESSQSDMKEEWKQLLEKRKSKDNFAKADKLTSDEEERRALRMAALIMGQKRLSDHTEMLKDPLNSTPFADYNQLGFNLRSNIFQGGPLESRSLMKDSYTPDIIQKALRDPKNWHGRRIDELGKWHQKNALNLKLQKALEDKYGKKNEKP